MYGGRIKDHGQKYVDLERFDRNFVFRGAAVRVDVWGAKIGGIFCEEFCEVRSMHTQE